MERTINISEKELALIRQALRIASNAYEQAHRAEVTLIATSENPLMEHNKSEHLIIRSKEFKHLCKKITQSDHDV